MLSHRVQVLKVPVGKTTFVAMEARAVLTFAILTVMPAIMTLTALTALAIIPVKPAPAPAHFLRIAVACKIILIAR